MAKEYKDLVVGLDIGTHKVMAVVAEVLANGELKLAGYGIATSFGLKRGVVVNIDATVASIQQAAVPTIGTIPTAAAASAPGMPKRVATTTVTAVATPPKASDARPVAIHRGCGQWPVAALRAASTAMIATRNAAAG